MAQVLVPTGGSGACCLVPRLLRICTEGRCGHRPLRSLLRPKRFNAAVGTSLARPVRHGRTICRRQIRTAARLPAFESFAPANDACSASADKQGLSLQAGLMPIAWCLMPVACSLFPVPWCLVGAGNGGQARLVPTGGSVPGSLVGAGYPWRSMIAATERVCSLSPVPCSLMPRRSGIPVAIDDRRYRAGLFPVPCPCSLFPVPCSPDKKHPTVRLGAFYLRVSACAPVTPAR